VIWIDTLFLSGLPTFHYLSTLVLMTEKKLPQQQIPLIVVVVSQEVLIEDHRW